MTILLGNAPLGVAGFARAKDIAHPNKPGMARALLATASAGVLAMSMATGAHAQAVPAECTPTMALTGGTIICVAPAPTVIDPIVTTVDDLTIVIGDATTPTTVNGVKASSTSATGAITVSGVSGTVNGPADGLDIDTMGADILVENLDSVTGNAGDGINAASNGGAITITGVDTILGTGGNGIFARNNGSGNTTITTADVGSTNGSGIYASTGSSTTGNLSIDSSAGSVTGSGYGILTRQYGTGAQNITANNVTATTNAAIFANGSGSSLDITVAGTATGRNTGIDARNGGSGALTINAVNAIGTNYTGIFARNGNFRPAGTDLSITSTGTVTGATGINASNRGSGMLSITSADATGTNQFGIYAFSYGGGITVDSRAGTVTGSAGISAQDAGAGAVSVTSADVTGMRFTGIDALSYGGGITVDSRDGTVTGGSYGINARNSGASAVSVSSANVTGGFTGIFAESIGGGVTIDSSAGTVTGGSFGISVRERSTGAVTITSADATGGFYGLFATANEGGVTVDSSAGTILGETNGIVARDSGAGAISVTSAGVTGTGGLGISASSVTGGVTVDSSAGMITGGEYGIFARDRGAGVVTVTAADVTAGTTGIDARADGNAVQISVAGDLSGGDNGILSVSQNGTQLDVAAGSTVSGGTVGIATMASGGSATSNDLLTIAGTVNGAIMTFEGDDIITLAGSSAINGAIMLGTGADMLNFNGSVTGTIRGGDDLDMLNFVGGGGLITNSGDAADAIDEFETFDFNVGGFALGGTHQGLTTTNFNVGDTMLLGTLSSTNVNIVTGGGLLVADGAIINGNLNNMGNLGVNASGVGTLNINGNLTQSAAGTLTLDVVNGTSLDQIIASGDVTLDGALVINQGAIITEAATLINGGTGLFGNFSSVSGLATNGLLVSQIVQLDRVNNDVNLSTSFTAATDITGLTTNQIAVANSLVSQLRVGGLTGGLEDIGLAIGSIGNANTLGNALNELHPEIVNGGIEVFRNSQMLFVRTLLNSSAPDFGSDPVQTASLAPVAMNKSSDGPHIWGSIQYTNYEQSGGLTNLSFDTDGFEVVTGISNIEAGPVTFGVAVGYAELDTIEDATGGDRFKTDLFRLGASAAIDLNQSNKGLQAHLDNAITAAFGSNEATMNIAIPAIGLAVQQNGKADIDSFCIFSRLTLDGIGDKAWAIKPHLMVGYNKTSQDALTLGNGPTALATQSGNFDRFTFGYGLTLEQSFNNNTALKVGVSGVHHSDDTQSLLTSRFVSGGAGAQPFNTTGKSIRDQYLFETSLDQNLGDGWTASVNGYVEFGDLEGFGGLIKIGKRF